MIKLNKLKEGNQILLETKESVFEIELLNPNTGRIEIVGSRRFPRRTRAKIVGAHDDDGKQIKGEIHQNQGVEIEYKDGETTNNFVTSPVLTAKVTGKSDEGKVWHHEVWSKPDITVAVSEAKKRK